MSLSLSRPRLLLGVAHFGGGGDYLLPPSETIPDYWRNYAKAGGALTTETFTRDYYATYTDADGNIAIAEYDQPRFDHAVTSNEETIGEGPESVTNGDFATGDTTGWTDGANAFSVVDGWCIADTTSNADLTQNTGTEGAYRKWEVSWEVESYTGDPYLEAFGVVCCDTNGTETGVITETIYGDYGDELRVVQGPGDHSVKFRNVSIKEITRTRPTIPLGIIMEPAVKNYLWCSDSFAYWWSPLGSPTLSYGDRGTVMTVSSNNRNTYISMDTESMADATQFIAYAIVRKGPTGSGLMLLRTTGALVMETEFDLNTGVVNSTNAEKAWVEPFNGDWWRCCMVDTTTSANDSTLFIEPIRATGESVGDSGDSIEMFGAQIEEGDFPHYFVPAIGYNGLSKPADVLTDDISSVGTVKSFLAEFDGATIEGAAAYVMSGGSPAKMGVGGGDGNLYAYDGVTFGSYGEVTNGGLHRIAGTEETDLALAKDGAVVLTGSASNPASNVGDTLYIGCSSASATQLNGHIRRVQLWETALDNTDLAGVTDWAEMDGRYWRLSGIDSHHSSDLQMTEVHLLDFEGLEASAIDVVDEFSGSWRDLVDRDNSTSVLWTDSTDNGTGSITYDFKIGVSPSFLNVRSVNNGLDGPRAMVNWTLQSSPDGSTWTDVMLEGGGDAFGQDEIRVYTIADNTDEAFPFSLRSASAGADLLTKTDITGGFSWSADLADGYLTVHDGTFLALDDGDYVQWEQDYTIPSSNYLFAGMGFRQSDGDIWMFGAAYDSGLKINVRRLNGSYTWQAHPYLDATHYGKTYFRVERDGGDLLYRVSSDGSSWTTVYTQTTSNTFAFYGPMFDWGSGSSSDTMTCDFTNITIVEA